MIPTMPNLRPFALGMLALATAAISSQAQTPAAPTPTLLTDQQVASVLQQLKDLEQTIARQRGDNLGAILSRLRAGAANEAAALAFYAECEKLVNVDRKELTREEEKRREEQVKRAAERNKETKDEEDGDFGTAVRLQLQYIILTLEARETKDIETLFPKLAAYLQDVVANAAKLKGRAGNYLAANISGGGGGGRGGQGGGNPFVSALQLERYLNVQDWSMGPVDFEEIWERTVLPVYRAKKKAELAAQWDVRINAETSYRKGAMAPAEFAIWQQSDLPEIRWARGNDLFANSDNPLQAMKDMLTLIRDNTGHPDVNKWLDQFRGLVGKTAPDADALPEPKPAAGAAAP